MGLVRSLKDSHVIPACASFQLRRQRTVRHILCSSLLIMANFIREGYILITRNVVCWTSLSAHELPPVMFLSQKLCKYVRGHLIDSKELNCRIIDAKESVRIQEHSSSLNLPMIKRSSRCTRVGQYARQTKVKKS